MSIVSYAQNFEDVMLWRALGTVEKGTYIDIGAQDPVVDSVSLAFYESGWRGFHIEPTPHYAEALRQARPEDEVRQVAIGRQAGVISFYEFEDTGLSTGSKSIADLHSQNGLACHEIKVDVLTLDDLFESINSRQIHWLKIDVEGMESDVIGGWKSSPVRPWVIVVESSRPGSREETYQQWEPDLLSKGYRYVYCDGVNRFYVSEHHLELEAAFGAPPNVFDEFILSGQASNSFCQRVQHQVHLTEVRAAEAESQAYHANQKVNDLSHSLHNVRAQLEGARSQLELVYEELRQSQHELQQLQNSRSWRMTLPLRRVGGRARSLLRRLNVAPGLPVGPTLNGAANRSLKWLARQISRSPRLKNLALATLRHNPWLFERLSRRLKRLEAHPDNAARSRLPADQARLTARARKIYQQLYRASSEAQ